MDTWLETKLCLLKGIFFDQDTPAPAAAPAKVSLQIALCLDQYSLRQLRHLAPAPAPAPAPLPPSRMIVLACPYTRLQLGRPWQ